MDDIHKWLDGGRLCVAESEAQVIDTVRIEETAPQQLEIGRLGVHDDWQSNGVASALLDHVEHLALAEDLETVWLMTPEDNPNHRTLHRNRGYNKIRD